MALAVGNDGAVREILRTPIGHAEWAQDARFARNSDRVRNREALTAMIADTLVQGDVRDWVARIEAAGVPCAAINTVPMARSRKPQIKHREMLRHLPHPLAGTVPQVVSPMRFQETPLAFDRPPPLLGEHTDEILRELGLDQTLRKVAPADKTR